MTHHEKPKDFGRYLQAQRISQGISLDAIARLTRITTACLKQIESEDMAQLPAPVFVKGFIKSYADAVGADKDEALARYEANLKAIVKTKRSQIRIKKQTPLLQRVLLAFVLLSAIVTATLLIADKYFSANHQEEPPAQGYENR